MKDYRTAAPWAATQGQNPPTGPELARTEPARAAGIVPDLVVPLGQAVVTGALGAGLVVFAISELVPGWSGSAFKVWAGLTLAISAATWGVLLGQTRRLLWAAERLTGFDLDRNSIIGKPTERVIMLDAAKLAQASASQQAREREAAAAQELGDFAKFVRGLELKGTAQRVWESELGRAKYTEFRDLLLEQGLARWNSYRPSGKPVLASGWALTRPAAEILAALE